MKKVLMTLVAVLAVATVAEASPRFGVVGYTNGAGVGGYISDDMYSASLTFGVDNTETGGNKVNELTNIRLAGNYKIALDSATSGTIGVSYTLRTGKVSDTDVDTGYVIALNAGVEKSVTSNLVMLAEVSLFETEVLELENASTKLRENTGIFNSGRVGIAYLF